MSPTMPTHIEQAYELGRAAERRKMQELDALARTVQLDGTPASLEAAPFLEADRIMVQNAFEKSASQLRRMKPKKPKASGLTAAADDLAAQKAPKVARGAKQAPGPRNKGVKKGIVALINVQPLTVKEIVEHTGFGEMSVRSTLAALKKSGTATSDENSRWYTILETEPNLPNSEAEAQQDVAF